MDERERYEAGLKVRREVLGDAHVDAALAKRNEFTEAFQDLLTRYAWGEIWSRPGLSAANTQPAHRGDARSAQSRGGIAHAPARRAKKWCEPRRTSRSSAAVRNLLRVPAANSAFRVAQEVFGENT